MSNDEKLNLISDIYQTLNSKLNNFDNDLGCFLAYLYPFIVADKKCQLWGSSYDDLVLLLFLQNTFDENHKIWDYIEFLEEEQFIVPATYFVKKFINWEFVLEAECYYNIYTKTCIVINENIYDSKGNFIEDWLEFDLAPNDLFDSQYIFKVKNPTKICNFCEETMDKCVCNKQNS